MICKYWKKFNPRIVQDNKDVGSGFSLIVLMVLFFVGVQIIFFTFLPGDIKELTQLIYEPNKYNRWQVDKEIFIIAFYCLVWGAVTFPILRHLWHLPDQNKYSIPEIEQKILNIQLTEIKIAIILRIILAVILPCIIVYYIHYLHSMVDLTIQKNGKLSEKELISLMIITTSAVSAMVFMIYHYSLKKSNGIDDKQDKTTEFNTQIAQDAQKLVNLATSLTTDKNTLK